MILRILRAHPQMLSRPLYPPPRKRTVFPMPRSRYTFRHMACQSPAKFGGEVLLKIFIRVLMLALFLAPTVGAEPPQQGKDAGGPPAWAYPVNPPDDKPAPDDGTLKHVPGSGKALTRTQALDSFNIPDWHPEEHGAMPDVVEHGRKPAVRGCGYCHLPNGLGRPENASLASLPASYIETGCRFQARRPSKL
jgi:hypothetical protein